MFIRFFLVVLVALELLNGVDGTDDAHGPLRTGVTHE